MTALDAGTHWIGRTAEDEVRQWDGLRHLQGRRRETWGVGTLNLEMAGPKQRPNLDRYPCLQSGCVPPPGPDLPLVHCSRVGLAYCSSFLSSCVRLSSSPHLRVHFFAADIPPQPRHSCICR